MPNCYKCRKPVRISKKTNQVHSECYLCREKNNKHKKSRHNRVARKNKAKGNCCRLCGFIAAVSAQLDIDHIDGDHSNNDPSNLQVICANCHRLKTYQNRDWEKKKEGVSLPSKQE